MDRWERAGDDPGDTRATPTPPHPSAHTTAYTAAPTPTARKPTAPTPTPPTARPPTAQLARADRFGSSDSYVKLVRLQRDKFDNSFSAGRLKNLQWVQSNETRVQFHKASVDFEVCEEREVFGIINTEFSEEQHKVCRVSANTKLVPSPYTLL